MSAIAKPLEEMIRELPPSLKIQVQTFVESLLIKPNHSTKPKLSQGWAGKLKTQGYSSIELQHLANEWRDS